MSTRACRVFGVRVVVCALMSTGVAAGPPTGAQGRVAELASARAGSRAASAVRTALILGAAWNADNSPIPNARLRLRNAVIGRIEATTIANESGQFTFTGIEGGTYVVELVSETGKVLTLGPTFTVAPGETVATFVRLGSRVPWFNEFFSNAAAAAASTAASAGVTAIAPGAVRPVTRQK